MTDPTLQDPAGLACGSESSDGRGSVARACYAGAGSVASALTVTSSA